MARDSDILITDNFFAGDDRVIRWTILDTDPTGGAAVDITGYAITLAIKAAVDDVAALVTKTVGSGIVLTDPTNGILDVTFEDLDTESLVEDNYVYVLRRTDDTMERVLAVGGFFIRQGALTM